MKKRAIKFKMSLGNISNSVNSIFFPGIMNPYIITVFNEDSIFLWNLKTSSLIASFFRVSKEFKKILKVDISYIYKLKIVFIAVGFDSGNIQIWKVNIIKTTVANVTLFGHNNSISCIKFSNDGVSLLSGCNKGDLIIWNLIEEKGKFKIKTAHEGSIKVILFLKSKKIKNLSILSFGCDNLIKIWKIKKNLSKKIIFIPEKNISSIVYNLKKNLLILTSKKSLLIFYHISKNFSLNSMGSFWKNDQIIDFKILLDKEENFLFLHNKNYQLDVFQFKNNTILLNLIKSEKIEEIKIKTIISKPVSFFFPFKIYGIDLWNNNIDSEITILIHTNIHILELYKFSRSSFNKKKNNFIMQKISRLKLDYHDTEVREIKWFKNSNSIIALCGISRTVYLWSLNSRSLSGKIFTTAHSLCFVLCGKKNIIIGNKEGSLEVYDILSKKLIWFQQYAHKGPVWSIDIAQNQLLVATAGADGILKIWEFEIKEISLLKLLNLKEQILSVKLIPAENIVIICSLLSTISIFLLSNLTFSFNFHGHRLPVICIAIRDDYSLIASGSADTSFRIWDIKHKLHKKIVWTNLLAVTAIEFQTHTGNLFTASRCGSISFWKDRNYKLIYQLTKCHFGPIWSLKSSINGKFIASCSFDKSIKIWKIGKDYDTNRKFNKTYKIKEIERNEFLKNNSINYSFKKKNFNGKFCNYIKLFLKDSINKKKIKNQKWNFIIFCFSQLRKKELIEFLSKQNLTDTLKILLKIVEIILSKNHSYNFEILERLFFSFRLIKNQLKNKKKSKYLNKLSSKLNEIVIKIDTDNAIINLALNFLIKKFSDLPDSN